MDTENSNQESKSNKLYTLLGNVNEENIYKMLHEFRNWNRDWDTFMAKKPKSADQFVAMLAKKYEVTPR
tara:strand:+ start:107 stop:313 length:207 start_codon:yes stop_codon:yes gene_type:complete